MVGMSIPVTDADRRDVIAFNATSSTLAGARSWDLVQDAAGWAVDSG